MTPTSGGTSAVTIVEPNKQSAQSEDAGKPAGLACRALSAWGPWRNLKALWPRKSARAQRLAVLDGIRMLAIFWLVAAEAFTSVFWPLPQSRYEFLGTSQYVLNADLAYDLLLLVSGVVITSAVLQEVDTTGSFRVGRFLLRRWLSIWPALAAGLGLTMLLSTSMREQCSSEWWAVLLFVNNYFGDVQCMPQTWLVAVLFQLYLLTPLLLLACVNFKTGALRQYMSGYILLIFLSFLAIFTAWLFYSFFGDVLMYSPTQWPPGPFFKGVFMRWSPYLSGMTIALLKWDVSIPLETTQAQLEAQNMPYHEAIGERMPISCTDASAWVLDVLGDILCLMIFVGISYEGTQQSVAYLSLIFRVAFGWVAARLVYRLLDGAYKGLGKCLSWPAGYITSQLAFSCFVLQGLVFIDIRGILAVPEMPAWEPVFQSAGLFVLAWLLFLLTFAAMGLGLFLVLQRPMLSLRDLFWPRPALAGPPATDPVQLLQRHKSRGDLKSLNAAALASSFGSLAAESVAAVNEQAIRIRSGTRTEMSVFRDSFSPTKGTKYFPGEQPPVDTDKDGFWILTVVTAYNEGGEEMAETLISLHEQAKNLPEGRRLHVLLVFDGWLKMSESMRRYTTRLFPGSEDEQGRAEGANGQQQSPRWVGEIDSTPMADWYRPALPVTFTLQQLDTEGRVCPVDIAPGRCLHVSCIIKHDNRRKHNSHEWYLRSFGKQYTSQLMYLTDVGTTADKYCLPRLVNYMEVNQDFAAVTGFQRVQKLRRGASLVQHLQREVQAYELGPGMCHVVKACQGLLGFQMIICGPCQMLRTSDALNESFLDAFFQMIDKDPAEAGILHANLQLTEDMAMGCYLYAMTPNKKTGYVPDAYFDYDVETAPDRLLKQRRRWNNGIFAGLHYLINPFGSLWSLSIKPPGLKLCNFLVMLQQYLLVMQFVILPSLVMFNIFASLGGLGDANTLVKVDTNPLHAIYYDILAPYQSILPFFGMGVYFCVLVFWVVSHSRREYVGWLYHVVLVFSLVIGALTISSLVGNLSPQGIQQMSLPLALVVALQFTSLLGPIISSLALGDSYGILVSIVNIPFLLVFFPMWIFLGAYSLARFADFTWGNRPHEAESQDGAKRSAYMKACRTIGTLISFMYLAGNLLIAALLITAAMLTGASPLLVNIVLAVPYALTSVVGLVFNLQYAAKYRWSAAFRRLMSPSSSSNENDSIRPRPLPDTNKHETGPQGKQQRV